MEAVGSGLGMIGFDVYYGNTTFIKDGINGFRISLDTSNLDEDDIVANISKKIVLFFEHNIEQMRDQSYKIADKYLIENIQKEWQTLIDEVEND